MIIFFDLETSGLDPEKHAIIQLAAVAVDESGVVVDQFEVKVKFRRDNADPEALNMNSFDADVWLKEAINPKAAAKQFDAFCKKYATVAKKAKSGNLYYVAQLAGHNAATFDKPFLDNWYKRLDIWLSANWFVIDTLHMALERQVFFNEQYPSLKLADLCEYHGISRGQTHDAVDDTIMTAALCFAILGKVALDQPQNTDEAGQRVQSIVDNLPRELRKMI